MGDQAVVDTERTEGLAPPAGRAPVIFVSHLIEVIIGQDEASGEPCLQDPRLGEISAIDTQKEFGTVTGDVTFFLSGLIQLTR